MTQKRLRSVGAFLLLGLVVLFTFSGLLSADQVPAYRDLLFFVLPFKSFLGEHLRRGEIPLWNPYIYMGTPFLASLQSGVFYPPSVFLLMPIPLGFNLFVLCHYLIALGGIWLLLRERQLGLAAAAVGSLTFVVGGYLVSMLNVTNHLQGAVWAPWVFLWWTRYVDGPDVRRLSYLTLFLVLQFLGGSPESQLMTLVLVAAWPLHHLFGHWRVILRRYVALGVALVFMAGLTAFQILPTVEYIQQSVRSGALLYSQVSSWSLQPISLIQLLLPHSSTLLDSGRDEIFTIFENSPPWVSSIYLGLVPLCLAIVGATRGRDRLFWSVTVLVGLALALGRHTPVLHGCYQLLPQIFGKFRFPEKFYFFVHFAAAMLAAEGAEQLVRAEPRARRLASIAALTFIAIAAITLTVRWYFPQQFLWSVMVLKTRVVPAYEMVPLVLDTTFKCERLILILGTFVVLGLLRRLSVLKEPTFALLLVGLVAADLASTNRDLNLTVSWSGFADQPKLIDVQKVRDHNTRVFHYQQRTSGGPEEPSEPVEGLSTWISGPGAERVAETYKELFPAIFLNVTMIEHVPGVGEGDGIQRGSDSKLKTALEVVDRPRAVRLLRAYSTEYLIGVGPLAVESLEEVTKAERAPLFVYRIRDPLPLARFVSRLRVASGEREAFNALISPDFPVEHEAVVEELPENWRDDPSEQGSARVLEMAHDRETVRMRVDAGRQAFLVLNDSDYPGWEATIDGVATKIHRTNGIVRGIVVPAGSQIVEFVYRPASWRRGIYISLATLLTIGAVAGLLWLAPRPVSA